MFRISALFSLASVLLAALGGCTEASVVVDAAAAPDAAVRSLAPPALPVLPTLTPCRAGWREVAGEEGVTLCDPWPATGRRDDCAVDEAHFPGTPGCARVGTACPADGWPVDLPTGRNVVYVSAAAALGGDGRTRATAFASIGAAADAAAFGSVIAIAAGHYDEREIYVGPNMILWGACVAGTEVGSTTASSTNGVIFLAENGSEARNLRVESPARLGVVADGTPSTLTDVVVRGARHIGVGGSGGALTLDHVLISGTGDGRGFLVQGTMSAALRFVRIDEATGIAVAVDGASARLDAEDTAVTRSRAGAAQAGSALAARGGAQTVLRGVVMEDVGDYAVNLAEAGTTLVASDLVVRHNTRAGAKFQETFS